MPIETSGQKAAIHSAASAPATTKKTLRPRNRKAQIIAVAREQFGRSGFHNVSMEEIASSVGITAGALYRHFPNKQEMLAQAMIATSESISAAADQVDPQDTVAVCLALARFGLDHNFRSILFDQETWNLPAERRGEVLAGVQGVVGRISRALRFERPDLPDAERELLSWALASLAFSPSSHRTTMPRKRVEELLTRLFDVVRRTPALPTERLPAAAATTTGISPYSRREPVLAAAINLFNQRGYPAVTMEDIGAAAGMSSSSIYTYFDSKADVIQAILARGSETLRIGLAQALRHAGSREDALARVVHAYATAALAPHSAVGILLEEPASLPEEVRARNRTALREYVDEWVHLMGADTQETRATVFAAIGLTNDLSRVRAPATQRAIETLALRVLAAHSA